MTGENGSTDILWRRVGELVDRAPTEDDLRSHRLQLLAARHFREIGRRVPDDFVSEERSAAVAAMTAPLVLERVAAAYGKPAIVLKGPEAARNYPAASLRTFGDIDLLVENGEEAQEALVRAGFEPVGEPSLFVDIHHLRPLAVEDLPLVVEIHSAPKWIEGARAPATSALFAAAVPGSAGIPGMLALPPEHHALILATHAWAHEPLRRLRDVVDVAAAAAAAPREDIQQVARAWGIARLWQTMSDLIDGLLGEGDPPRVLDVWAQNLKLVRERTVLEHHLERWLSDFWALPARTAVARIPKTLANEARPAKDERWRAKLTRSLLAVRHARRRRSHHEQDLQERFTEPGDRPLD